MYKDFRDGYAEIRRGYIRTPYFVRLELCFFLGQIIENSLVMKSLASYEKLRRLKFLKGLHVILFYIVSEYFHLMLYICRFVNNIILAYILAHTKEL